MRSSTLPAGEIVATADQRIVMHGVPWSHYEKQLDVRGDHAAPRIAYLDGALELMSPSKDHERLGSLIGCLVEAYALEAGIEFSPYGSWTLKNRPREAGAEPDECYIFGQDQDRRVPDLVIEVVWTSGGLDKLELYRRLGVPEFWQWDSGRIRVYVLRRGRYELAPRSAALPGLDLDLLTRFLDRPSASQAIRAFRSAMAGSPRQSRARAARGAPSRIATPKPSRRR